MMSDSGDPKLDKQRELEAERKFYEHPNTDSRELDLDPQAKQAILAYAAHKQAQRVKENRSLCGCQMCEFHVGAYEIGPTIKNKRKEL